MDRRGFLQAGAGLIVAGGGLLSAASPAAARTLPLPFDIEADFIHVDKSRRTLTLFRRDRVLRVYRVALGKGGPGPKRREGDKKTPEGRYVIDGRNADSVFHLALHISYPNRHDVAVAEALGVPPGDDIMIHGLPNGIEHTEGRRWRTNWTAGCIAVSNPAIEELWRVVPDGTPIKIVA